MKTKRKDLLKPFQTPLTQNGRAVSWPISGRKKSGLLSYIRKKFLSIYLSCLFNFDQFEGHFGLFGAVPGYLGVGVGSENYFGVYSYILSTFVF